ncbi:tat pathway signal sequence [Diplodia corticola]|uniref:Tat pathway signal sequence n=1 Tax=Diplodia corticola TaxID=236234 RepID=A0A1J9QWW9_9PEZI|nr:tat pathway signal sequence [Diplodia corticola]OJD32482.1 tat pathway signal sequence [Diplodia corticola]
MSSKERGYERVSHDSSADGQADEQAQPFLGDAVLTPPNKQRRRTLCKWLFVACNIVMFHFSLGALYFSHKKGCSGSKGSTFYTPLFDHFDVPTVDVMSKAQYGDGGPTIWKAPPSEATDEAWNRMMGEHVFPVSKASVDKLRKDADVAVKMPGHHHDDGDDDQYMASVAVFHHIHCLDWLRKQIHRDYYYPNGTDDNFNGPHTAHCIHVLMDQLTCHADLGVYLWRWMDDLPMPIADTNIWSKCVDFDTLHVRYAELTDNGVEPRQVSKPPGAKSVPIPYEIREIMQGRDPAAAQ